MSIDIQRQVKREKATASPQDIIRASAWPEEHLSDNMAAYLHQRDLSYHLARHNGWYQSNMDCPRMVIPAQKSGIGNYWQARDIFGFAKLRYRSPAVPRGDAVIVVQPYRYSQQYACICEGPMDALAMAEFGILSIALMGTNPTAETISHVLSILHTQFQEKVKVLIMADTDAIASAVRVQMAIAGGGYTTIYISTEGTGYKDFADCSINIRKWLIRRWV